jgi:hypothetical protein
VQLLLALPDSKLSPTTENRQTIVQLCAAAAGIADRLIAKPHYRGSERKK